MTTLLAQHGGAFFHYCSALRRVLKESPLLLLVVGVAVAGCLAGESVLLEMEVGYCS